MVLGLLASQPASIATVPASTITRITESFRMQLSQAYFQMRNECLVQGDSLVDTEVRLEPSSVGTLDQNSQIQFRFFLIVLQSPQEHVQDGAPGS